MNVGFNPNSGVQKTVTRDAAQRDAVQNDAKEKTVTRRQDQVIITSNQRTRSSSTNHVSEDQDTSVTPNAYETTFPEFNPVKQLAKYAKVVKAHYSKVNEENKRFDDPEQHIWKKYNDRSYKHYVKGLTEMERDICYNQEMDVYAGKEPNVNHYDPVMQENFGGHNVFKRDMDYNVDMRNEINESINQLFKENGIVIPEGADLRLTVDPYDLKIHASGVDEELAGKIENALNKGKNGYNLYSHLLYSNPANLGAPEPPQYTSGGEWKASTYRIVKGLTGYDLRELENKDGKFITPDGRDVWDVVREEYQKLCEKEGVSSIPGLDIGGLDYEKYKILAQTGWENSPDKDLSIGYQDGSLYDIDTEHGYGPGQTGWLDQINERFWTRHEQYQAERKETLRYEESRPNKLEQFQAYAKSTLPVPIEETDSDSIFEGVGLIGLNGELIPMRPISREALDNLTNSLKLAEMALSKSIFHIPGTTGAGVVRKGFNLRI